MAKPTGDFWALFGCALFALGIGGCTMMVNKSKAWIAEAEAKVAVEKLTERVERIETTLRVDPEED